MAEESTLPQEIGVTTDVSFGEHMRNMFIIYSRDVVTNRALVDVRDGLKPVHRRIVQTMYGLGLHPGSAYKKCARSVGQCLGLYHPHGFQF